MRARAAVLRGWGARAFRVGLGPERRDVRVVGHAAARSPQPIRLNRRGRQTARCPSHHAVQEHDFLFSYSLISWVGEAILGRTYFNRNRLSRILGFLPALSSVLE